MIPRNKFHLTRWQWQVIVPFCVFVLHSLFFRSWLIDDAGISFAYARNFIHGHGIVAQARVDPVEGFSNPLWTFLIAPVFVNDPVNPTLPVKLISLALVFCTFLVVNRISHIFFEESVWSRLVTLGTTISLSINTSFVVWTTSGLENPLYAFLSALYCFSSLRYVASTSNGPHVKKISYLAGISVAGLALTRPDGIIFAICFPLLVALQFVRAPLKWKIQMRNLVAFALAASLPVIVCLAIRYVYFGDLYPNAYHAKGGPSFRDFLGLVFLKEHYVNKTYNLLYSMFSWRTGLVVLFLGICSIFAVLRTRQRLLFTPLLLMVIASWAIYCVLPDDWMGEYRFGTPFFVLFNILLFILVAVLFAYANVLSIRFRELAFLALLIGFIAQSAVIYLPRSLQFAKKPTVPFSFVARDIGINFNYYADTLGISEASLLCPDLGGTLYFSRHRVYDLAGLCDRRFAQLKCDRDTQGLKDYVFDVLRPTFIHVHDFWSVYSGFHSDPRFRTLYTPIKETPSEWAQKRGKEVYFSGDYVRRDAISSETDLHHLRMRLTEKNQQEHSHDEEKMRPFPRG